MHNSYVIDEKSIDILKSRYLLLDTNFLIDSALFGEEVLELINRFNELGCELITTRSVIIEFLGGTRNFSDLGVKVDHLKMIFNKEIANIVSLPVDRDFPAPDDFLRFSRQCKKFSMTDFELFLTLKKYASSKLLLVTRNHLDFTTKLFDRNGFITLLGNKEIRTYGLYEVKS